jgi:hypothetical protein
METRLLNETDDSLTFLVNGKTILVEKIDDSIELNSIFYDITNGIRKEFGFIKKDDSCDEDIAIIDKEYQRYFFEIYDEYYDLYCESELLHYNIECIISTDEFSRQINKFIKKFGLLKNLVYKKP